MLHGGPRQAHAHAVTARAGTHRPCCGGTRRQTVAGVLCGGHLVLQRTRPETHSLMTHRSRIATAFHLALHWIRAPPQPSCKARLWRTSAWKYCSRTRGESVARAAPYQNAWSQWAERRYSHVAPKSQPLAETVCSLVEERTVCPPPGAAHRPRTGARRGSPSGPRNVMSLEVGVLGGEAAP